MEPQNPEFRINPENFHPCKTQIKFKICPIRSESSLCTQRGWFLQVGNGVFDQTGWKPSVTLTLCILETPNWVLQQTVKTQMKCISSGSALFAIKD